MRRGGVGRHDPGHNSFLGKEIFLKRACNYLYACITIRLYSFNLRFWSPVSRPSQNTDQRLIEAAREMLGTSALSRMNLREVAKKAGVNLGMFHYHFKTKDQFTRAVLQDTYDKFFREFSLESSRDGEPLQNLRGALFTLGKFMLDNRRMLLGILHDVL